MMSVTIILLNILIAQLSLTYELVQEESLHSFTALRMQTVATIEWQSRFKFWVSTYMFTWLFMNIISIPVAVHGYYESKVYDSVCLGRVAHQVLIPVYVV